MHLERRVDRYSMSEKKVVAFIVEGPSDEAALGTIMKEYFSSNEVQFVVMHGDITLKDYVSADSILKKINEQLDVLKTKYRYHLNDFIKIIHIADTDGVYIPDEDVKEADVEEVQYCKDHIDVRNASAAIDRNRRKGAVPGTYQKTWDYIETDRNSLNRHTNMHLIFK